ncbi:hypothetical protein FRC03_006615 [Tulasnella sp. 419]|nr:hypothetical protein FRC03_006615 [Tulasnella sp. 419]
MASGANCPEFMSDKEGLRRAWIAILLGSEALVIYNIPCSSTSMSVNTKVLELRGTVPSARVPQYHSSNDGYVIADTTSDYLRIEPSMNRYWVREESLCY